jgi:hypothetical protein
MGASVENRDFASRLVALQLGAHKMKKRLAGAAMGDAMSGRENYEIQNCRPDCIDSNRKHIRLRKGDSASPLLSG